MKIKELIELLKKYDGELEVMKHEDVLSQYFPLDADEIQGYTDVYEIAGGFVQVPDAVEMCECNEEEFDEGLVKPVFII